MLHYFQGAMNMDLFEKDRLYMQMAIDEAMKAASAWGSPDWRSHCA